jgi:hypothetical protein
VDCFDTGAFQPNHVLRAISMELNFILPISIAFSLLPWTLIMLWYIHPAAGKYSVGRVLDSGNDCSFVVGDAYIFILLINNLPRERWIPEMKR